MKASPSVPLPPAAYIPLIEQALAEDIGAGDCTTRAVLTGPLPSIARIRAKERIVVAGLWLVPEVFGRLDPAPQSESLVQEGQTVEEGSVLLQLRGDARPLLTGERVALNFLQRLCGIATLTSQFVEAVKEYKAVILDTRKTTPGWRPLEKYAVRTGGGRNHRSALDAGILIKDNHIALVGDAKEAIRRARKDKAASGGIEVEARTLEEVQAVLELLQPDKDVLMLDNMTPTDIKKAMEVIRGSVRVEVSGGITLSNIREFAASGVEFISIGALTHSARSVDISMDVVAVE